MIRNGGSLGRRIGCLLLACCWFIGSAWAKTPNIVLILADDLGFTDTAPYGGEIRTPHISRLADEGVVFTNYHTAATCAPSRAMLLTGVDSHRNGVPNIPEAMPPSQSKHPHYRGTLNHHVVTVATLLRDAGFHTYMTGKWHLGMQSDLLPSRRGFDRTFILADTGADNWEKKPYLPMYLRANWFADGRPVELPDDFYSSEFLIDKAIAFIDSNRGDGRPFFSYIAFQAVHIPVQAPREFTDRYHQTYIDGWNRLRERRLEAAKALGIVPQQAETRSIPTTLDWDSLSLQEQRYEARKMAVYAGMVEAMDHHIGRLITYLEETGQLDDTVFIFTSDNGAEASDAFAVSLFEVMYLRLWMKVVGYRQDYETLGERGSYINMGPSFASAAVSPLAYYKFSAFEGGLRVPLIIAGKDINGRGRLSNAFTFVTDITPTILDLAGVALPSGRYRDRAVEPIIGRSLLPLLSGEGDRVYGADDTVGYELGGNAALFQGDYKIVLERPPFGDGQWQLYNIVTDPGETVDLMERMPERSASMLAAYHRYAEENRVLPVPDDYEQLLQVRYFSIKTQLRFWAAITAIGVCLLLLIVLWRRRRRLRR
jgi:arylsulfatase A-like enzyme